MNWQAVLNVLIGLSVTCGCALVFVGIALAAEMDDHRRKWRESPQWIALRGLTVTFIMLAIGMLVCASQSP